MNRRTKVLLIALPVMFAIVIGIITTLSLPFYTLGPEKMSFYTTMNEASDFSVEDVTVKYYNPDELTVRFFITGGDGSEDLKFEFICRDINGDHIYASTSGTMKVDGIGSSATNSTTIQSSGLVIGILKWENVPSGDQTIKAVITLDDIVLDTESFFVELRNIT